MHEVVLHPRKYPEQVKIAENFVWYAKSKYLNPNVQKDQKM